MRYLLVLCLIAAAAAPFDLTRTVDRTSVTLGEPVLLKVKAVRKPDEKLVFPGAEHAFGDFELRNMRSAEAPQGNTVAETHEYVLVLFKLGEAQIPPLKVFNAGDTSDFKTTDPVDIVVKKVTVADTSDIVDIYDQETLGHGPLFYMVIALVVVLLALALLLADRFLKRRKTAQAAPPPPVPPGVRFARDIDALRRAQYLEKGEVKAFHFAVSEILRRYLGARFGFYALESTTAELLYGLRLKKADPEVERMAGGFCDVNDPVKFAKWVPKTRESEALIETAWEIVRKTTRAPSVSNIPHR